MESENLRFYTSIWDRQNLDQNAFAAAQLYNSTEGDGKFTSESGGLCRRFWRHASLDAKINPGHSFHRVPCLQTPASEGSQKGSFSCVSSRPQEYKYSQRFQPCLFHLRAISRRRLYIRANGPTIVSQKAVVLVVLHPSVTYATAEPSTFFHLGSFNPHSRTKP